MPGVVSESSRGPSDDSPYIPSWSYKNGPKQCPCGHGENYHNDNGDCLLERKCGCVGLPDACRTPFEEMD